MRTITKLLFLALSILTNNPLTYSQQPMLDKYESYYGKIPQLLNVETKEQQGKVYFYAENNSLYPLWVKIECNLRNMSCSKSLPFDEVVFPGRSSLFYLEVSDNLTGYSYNFKYIVQIGNPFSKHKMLSYLIPLKAGKKVKLSNIESENFLTFPVKPGDTIYSSRNGYVCGVPGSDHNTKRGYSISGNLEIMHRDGTIGIYTGLSPAKLFVKIGQKVESGVPLGTAIHEMVHFEVIKFSTNSKIERVPLHFFTKSNESTILINDFEYEVLHPERIIELEMSKREIKKREKRLAKEK